MKRILNFTLWLTGFIFLFSCGKPNDPESLIVPDNSGGYSVLTRFATSGYAQDILKKDSLLYIAQGEGGLLILNINDPENPDVVSTTTDYVKGYCSKIAMQDTAVYLAAGTFGVNVINITDLSAPHVTVSNLNVKPARNFYILGNYLYTAISEQGVGICEISYPTFPDIRGTVYTIGFAYDLIVTPDTNRMIVACGEMGLSIYNISQLQDGYGVYWPMGWCDTPGYAEALAVVEDQSLAFLACGTAGLQILNYADTANIHIIGSYDGSGYAKDLVKDGDKIYMATELSGLQVIDISDVTNPYLTGQIETEFALGVYYDEQYIYVADEDEGLIIVSKPD
jgi:hypothetical protein